MWKMMNLMIIMSWFDDVKYTFKYVFFWFVVKCCDIKNQQIMATKSYV